jgi:Peptidase A4 family
LINRKFGSLLSVLAVTALIAIPTTAASASAAATSHAVRSPSLAVTAHQVNACGLQLTIYTPKTSGAAMPGSELGMPSGKNTLLGMAASQHFRWLSTVTCQTRPAMPVPEQPRTAAANKFLNWAGYDDSTSKPNYIQAYWHIPTVSGKSSTTQYSSTWVGIGDGDASGTDLIQDGTEQNVSAAGKATYFFWLETFPKPQQEITNLAAHHGDKVAASSAYGTSKKGDATFVLCDVSKKRCIGFSEAAKHPDNHAEWIVERTAYCNKKARYYYISTLPKLSTVQFIGGFFDLSSKKKHEHTISQGHPVTTYMVSVIKKKDVTMAAPGKLTGGGTAFQVKWESHGVGSRLPTRC